MKTTKMKLLILLDTTLTTSTKADMPAISTEKLYQKRKAQFYETKTYHTCSAQSTHPNTQTSHSFKIEGTSGHLMQSQSQTPK